MLVPKQWYFLSVLLIAAGCSSLTQDRCGGPTPDGDDNKCNYDPTAKTLLSWATCKDKEKEEGKDEKNGKADEKKDEEKKNGDDKKDNGNGDKNNGDAKGVSRVSYTTAADGSVVAILPQEPPANGGNGNGGAAPEKANGNGNGNGAKADKPEEEEPIKTDRPDFTEASSTVGKGRIQIESGYTFFTDRSNGAPTHQHSSPEILVRAGVFADWFELRLGQNVNNSITRASLVDRVNPNVRAETRVSGLEDLYIGAKIALTEQKGAFPELATIVQATVPTGGRLLTANKFLPGLSLLYSWELTPKWSLAGSVLVNKSVTGERRSYYEFANSLSLGRAWTERLGSYLEYFAFYPSGASDPEITPQYYLNGGFTYLITKNIQFDIRAGLGLNRTAADFFAGSGLSIRF